MVVIALLAEEEEEHIINETKKRKKVHRSIWADDVWQERCTFGEYHTLCANLKYRGILFYDYYKMDYEKFEMLVNMLRPHIEKQNTNYRSTISVEERLTICLR